MPKKEMDSKAPKNLYIVIIAGGVGTRLWPLSRRKSPKQFLKIFNGDGDKERSLIQITAERLKGFLPMERLFTVAPASYTEFIKDQLPDLPESNIIAEPEKRGTTAANIFAATWIKNLTKNENAVIHFLVADDHIEKVGRFRRMIRESYDYAGKGNIVVFGVRPAYAATGFGYIKTVKQLSKNGEIEIFKVKEFEEKPDKATAEKYLKAGNYFWHGSGFMSSVKTMLDELKRSSKGFFSTAQNLEKALKLPTLTGIKELKRVYSQIEEVPIEKTLLEKSDNVVMALMEDSWSDLGSWTEVFEVFRKKGRKNVILGKKGNVIQIESKDSMIYSSDRMIALVGLDNMVVIDTPDAILVSTKEEAQKVKLLVKKLKKENRSNLL